jgi:mono/diheme cytochrome c family protein
MKRTAVILFGGLSSILTSSIGAAEPVDDPQDIRPILQKHCAKCHGAQEQNGGINFDVRASVYTEADSGKRPVVAGNVDASELISRITSSDEDLQMPPEGPRLSRERAEFAARHQFAIGVPRIYDSAY